MCPIDRQSFLDQILGSGLLVYLSPVWVSEVFDLVTEMDVFEISLMEKNATNKVSNYMREFENEKI